MINQESDTFDDQSSPKKAKKDESKSVDSENDDEFPVVKSKKDKKKIKIKKIVHSMMNLCLKRQKKLKAIL